MLDQVRGKATYVIRQGHVEIVHPSHATAKMLLQQRVLTRFDKVTLREALDDLAAITGAPIVFDVRAKDKGEEKVSIVLNNMTLEDSLIVLTEQAGLRFVTLQSGIFVTSPADAKCLEERQKDRPKQLPEKPRHWVP
jgi:type II secretory pathway component GspD/PulD (secretin)